jgi:thioredoxin-related protein
MVRYLFLSLIFITCHQTTKLSAQNKIRWYTWDEAIERSKKDKKKIFIDVYTDWCGWCKKMDKTTFAEDHIAKYINANYYAIKFDAEMTTPVMLKGTEYKHIKSGQRGYHELAAYLLQGKMSYPTTVFLDEDFNLIQSIPGFQDLPAFEMIITYFGSNSHKSVPWNRYMQSFEKNSFFNAPVGRKD